MTATQRRTPDDVFRGSQARREGLVTRGELRGSKYRRLFQDVYVRANLPVTHALRCRAAALIVPDGAVLTGRSAATVRGVPLAKTYDPVEFVVPERHRFGPIRGIDVRRTEVARCETRPWQGIRVARARRIALDLVLRLSPKAYGWIRRLRLAVPDLDRFVRAGHVRRATLARLFSQRRNRGIRLARSALAVVDPRAESPPESDLRVVLHYAGFSTTPQYVVRDDRRFVARVDLALVADRIAVEYDGRWHLSPTQRARDQERIRRLEHVGWHVVVVNDERLATDPHGIIAELLSLQR